MARWAASGEMAVKIAVLAGQSRSFPYYTTSYAYIKACTSYYTVSTLLKVKYITGTKK